MGEPAVADVHVGPQMLAAGHIGVDPDDVLEAQPGPAIKSAWVAADAKNAAVVRLWQALANLNPAMGRHIKIFSNEDDALAWLADPAA